MELKERRLDCDKSKVKTVWKMSLVSFLTLSTENVVWSVECSGVVVVFRRREVGKKKQRCWLVGYTKGGRNGPKKESTEEKNEAFLLGNYSESREKKRCEHTPLILQGKREKNAAVGRRGNAESCRKK